MRRTFALAGLIIVLGACGGRSGDGPAWPRSAGRMESTPAKDGGESLEPQQASHIAAVERAEDKTPAVGAADIVVVEAPATPVEIPPLPANAGAPTPPAGEVEIQVIEIKPEDIQLDR